MQDEQASKYIMNQINSKSHLYNERISKVQNTRNLNRNWLMQVQTVSNKAVTPEQQIMEYITPLESANPKHTNVSKNQFISRNRYLTRNTDNSLPLAFSLPDPTQVSEYFSNMKKSAFPTIESTVTPRESNSDFRAWTTPNNKPRVSNPNNKLSEAVVMKHKKSDQEQFQEGMHEIYKRHSTLVVKEGKIVAKNRTMHSANQTLRDSMENLKRPTSQFALRTSQFALRNDVPSSAQSLTGIDTLPSRSKSRSQSKEVEAREKDDSFKPHGKAAVPSKLVKLKLNIDEERDEINSKSEYSPKIESKRSEDQSKERSKGSDKNKDQNKYRSKFLSIVTPEITNTINFMSTSSDPRLFSPFNARDVRLSLIKSFKSGSSSNKFRGDIVNEIQKYENSKRTGWLGRPQSGSYYFGKGAGTKGSMVMDSKSVKALASINYNYLTTSETFDSENSKLLFKEQINKHLHMAIKEGKVKRPQTTKIAFGSLELKDRPRFFGRPLSQRAKPKDKKDKDTANKFSQSEKKITVVGVHF